MKKKKPSIPRHKRMKRASRLQAAVNWIPKYEGKNIVKGYSKHFAVDKLCAVKELEMLAFKFEPDHVKRLKESIAGEQKARQRRKLQKEQEKALNKYPYSDERFFYITGHTSGGLPFGVTWEEMNMKPYADECEEDIENEESEIFMNENDDIPF
ncbi:MAG: hypothetical protein AB1796_08010 [Bacillota bacterium]